MEVVQSEATFLRSQVRSAQEAVQLASCFSQNCFLSPDGRRQEAGESRGEAESQTRAQEREGLAEGLQPTVSPPTTCRHLHTPVPLSPVLCFLRVLEEASASQASSKKDSRVDQSGKNRSYDIRIENFDVSFGER